MGAACRDGGGIAWVGLYRPTPRSSPRSRASSGCTSSRSRTPSTRTSGQARALRRHAVLRPAPGPLHRRDRDRRVRRGARVRRADFVITVRHGEAPDLGRGPPRASRRGPDLLRRGPVAILHAIMDRVVDDYAPVVAGVENDIDEIEDEVFGGAAPTSRAASTSSPRGHRVPARHQAARRDARAPDGRRRASTTRSAATCATSRTTRCAWSSRPTPSASCFRTS